MRLSDSSAVVTLRWVEMERAIGTPRPRPHYMMAKTATSRLHFLLHSLYIVVFELLCCLLWLVFVSIRARELLKPIRKKPSTARFLAKAYIVSGGICGFTRRSAPFTCPLLLLLLILLLLSLSSQLIVSLYLVLFEITHPRNNGSFFTSGKIQMQQYL